MQRREEFFQATYHMEDTASTCSSCSVARAYAPQERIECGSGGSRVSDKGYESASLGYDTMSQGSHDSDEVPPAIPPKKKNSLPQVGSSITILLLI